jgi:hypothetical protein
MSDVVKGGASLSNSPVDTWQHMRDVVKGCAPPFNLPVDICRDDMKRGTPPLNSTVDICLKSNRSREGTLLLSIWNKCQEMSTCFDICFCDGSLLSGHSIVKS